jgi:hypothetical protein
MDSNRRSIGRHFHSLGSRSLRNAGHSSSSSRLLTLNFKCKGSGEEGYITNAYDPNTPHLKRIFMDEINLLGASMINQVWILRGDFNMITNLWRSREVSTGLIKRVRPLESS